MATINDGELCLEVAGATEVQLRSGLAAARSVLDSAGVDYEAAFYASWKPEYIDDQGTGEMSGREWELNEVWWSAREAAAAAAGAGESSRVVLAMWQYHLEAEQNFQEALKINPEVTRVPAPDAGPHYTAERASPAAA
jgi:hypothetical protein